MIALDSTAIIDIYKKEVNLLPLLEGLKEDLATTIMNYYEIIIGLNPKDRKYSEEYTFYESLFNNLEIFNLNNESVKKASSIFWELKANGDTINDFDCLIAAICLNNGVKKIITKNKKHFERVKGLEIVSY